MDTDETSSTVSGGRSLPASAAPMPDERPMFDDFYVRTHAPMVRALALALGDDELGRDAAAEAFTRALQRWDKVAVYANPAGWTYRVGLNWATSRLRKLRREVHVTAERAEVRSVRDPSISAALRALSVDHRAVVVGRFYLDWSETQLAEALDIPAGTVKSRLSRALERLTTLLEASHG